MKKSTHTVWWNSLTEQRQKELKFKHQYHGHEVSITEYDIYSIWELEYCPSAEITSGEQGEARYIGAGFYDGNGEFVKDPKDSDDYKTFCENESGYSLSFNIFSPPQETPKPCENCHCIDGHSIDCNLDSVSLTNEGKPTLAELLAQIKAIYGYDLGKYLFAAGKN